MSNSSSSPNRWPAVLLLAAAVFGPPSAAVLTFVHAVTQNPWLTVLLILFYELIVFAVSIVSKIWQKVEGIWVEEVASALDNIIRRTLSGYYHHYCEYFQYEHRDIDMKGVSIQGIYTLDLDQVFVELQIDPKPAHQASADPLRIPSEIQSGSHTIWKYLGSRLLTQHLVILGSPGSGKTTLLKHLALTLLHHKKLYYENHLERKLPLLLFLREHSAAINNTPRYSLPDAVQAQVRKWKRPMPPGWIEHRLLRGQCLILLDGLDEVADPTLRQQTVDWVQDQMIAYGKNRFVITSRPFGYRSNPLGGVTLLEVQPFTVKQVKQFVNNWYLANEIRSAARDDPGVRMRARENAEDLLRRLRETPTLFTLAVNPLLLTMITTIHRYRGALPSARITLYKEICDVFLGKRQEARGIRQELSTGQRQLVLQLLAYDMMLKELKEIGYSAAQEVIKDSLERVNSNLSPEEFLHHIENTSGLLLEREQGIYTFAHLTFQEYLAAMYIRENHLEVALAAQVEKSWWHETIRLYCAQSDATPIIAACLTSVPSSIPALTLALECLQEARDVQTDVKQKLNIFIDQCVEDPDPKRRRVVAEGLLAYRLHQMRPLNEQIYADVSFITCAEYQLFLDEQRAEGKDYQPDHWIGASFPFGDGRKPVLGVRRSDALAFCTWLTNRDGGIWHYRLPQQAERERENESIGKSLPKGTGYWMNDEETFAWAREEPSPILKRFHQRLYSHFSSALFVSTQPIGLDLDGVLDYVCQRGLYLGKEHESTITTDRLRARHLNNTHAGTLNIHRNLDREHMLAIIYARTRELKIDTSSGSILRAQRHDEDYNLENRRVLALALAALAFYVQTLLGYPEKQVIKTIVIVSLELYGDLYLLQERIEGKFPAYEGILVVKERKPEFVNATDDTDRYES